MSKRIARAVSDYLTNFINTQFILTLISLPILVAWGLGTSSMSFVGNLIFTPMLMLFLIISSLMLATDLLGLSNNYLATALDSITSLWNWMLELGSSGWLITFASPPALVLLAVPLVTWWILTRKWLSRFARTLALWGFFGLCLGASMVYRSIAITTKPTVYLQENLYCIVLKKTASVIVVDDGFFARKKSIEKTIEYEVKPQITKNYGTVTLAEFRINNPTCGSFLAAQYLCEHWKVGSVWLPFFKKHLSKSAWRAYFDLQRLLKEKQIPFVRYVRSTFYASRASASLNNNRLKTQS